MKSLIRTAIACAIALFAAPSAFACMIIIIIIPTEGGTPTTTVNFVEPGKAQISFKGYETTEVEPNDSCIVALPPVDGLLAVNRVINYDTATGEPLSWVDFRSSKTPGREIADIAEDLGLAADDTNWHGFLTRVTASVEAGSPNHFVLDVTLDPDVTPWEFVQSLREDGVWATSSSDALGNPTPDHNHFLRVADTELVVTFPPN
ncbi:MAG: hypothetical protein AAF604_13845 [Acidobacteriota bacterium]